jgi:hypothetical protein
MGKLLASPHSSLVYGGTISLLTDHRWTTECALLVESTGAIRNHTECNEGTCWVIPERSFIEAVARLNGVTNPLGCVSSGPRSGPPTGDPLSEAWEIQMRRNYTREKNAEWELNTYVKEMTKTMRVELMETRRAEEAARSVREDPDTHMSDADATPGGPMLAKPAAAPVEVGCATSSTTTSQPTSTSHVMKSMQQTIDTPVVGDWYCVCRKWRRPTQAICQCGGSTHQIIDFDTDADNLVRSGPSPKDLADLRTGVTAPDDSARPDDQEQSDVKETLALSIQLEDEATP